MGIINLNIFTVDVKFFYTVNILIIIVKLFKTFDTQLTQMIRPSTHQLRKMLDFLIKKIFDFNIITFKINFVIY